MHGGFGAGLAGHAHPAIVDAVRTVLEEHPHSLAGLLIEPVMMNIGVVTPPIGLSRRAEGAAARARRIFRLRRGENGPGGGARRRHRVVRRHSRHRVPGQGARWRAAVRCHRWHRRTDGLMARYDIPRPHPRALRCRQPVQPALPHPPGGGGRRLCHRPGHCRLGRPPTGSSGRLAAPAEDHRRFDPLVRSSWWHTIRCMMRCLRRLLARGVANCARDCTGDPYMLAREFRN
jgi:hypothetical protein